MDHGASLLAPRWLLLLSGRRLAPRRRLWLLSWCRLLLMHLSGSAPLLRLLRRRSLHLLWLRDGLLHRRVVAVVRMGRLLRWRGRGLSELRVVVPRGGGRLLVLMLRRELRLRLGRRVAGTRVRRSVLLMLVLMLMLR